MSKFWFFIGDCLGRLALLFQYLYQTVDTWSESAHRKCKKPDLAKEIDALCINVSEFISDPDELAETVLAEDQEYKSIARMYLLLKQVSSVYEAESQVLPIQVFNEMRSALDHFVRSIIKIEGADNRGQQLSRMKGHVFRATLDSIKLACEFYNKTIKVRHQRFKPKVLGMVDSGEYIKKVTHLQTLSHASYREARIKDLHIDGDTSDVAVLNQYLEALLLHKKAYDYQAENYHKIVWAMGKSLAGFTLSTVQNLVLALFVGGVCLFVDKVYLQGDAVSKLSELLAGM